MGVSLTPGSASWWLRISLAPLCLLLVAGLHFVRVHTCGQTPWKGGGFGMFSTIDGKDARILKAWLVTAEGRVPVTIPKWLEKRADECRAAPSAAGLQDLAARLAELNWVDHDREWRDIATQYDSLSPGAPVDGTLLHAQPTGPQAAHPLVMETTSHVATRPGRRADVEPSGRAGSGKERGLTVRSVELELGRLRFDQSACRLACEPLLSASARPEVRP